jgi:hypothetical protein
LELGRVIAEIAVSVDVSNQNGERDGLGKTKAGI